jgi:lipoate-protein ligase A
MRRDGVVLQHGALPLVGHARQLATLLTDVPTQLGERMIALDQAAGRPIDFDEAVAAFTSGFTQAWGIHFEPGSLTPQEQALAEQLEHEKYRAESWTFSR